MTRRATNMFVCITLDLFDWVTHTGLEATPKRGACRCGGDTTTDTFRVATAWRRRPPDGHTHNRGMKGKATLCKQIAGASAVPLGYKPVCVTSHHCVLSTRSYVDCSVKLPGNRPKDYSITLTYWLV